MANGNSGDAITGNAPIWLQVLVRFGGYAAIAFFLIWFLTSRIEGSLQGQSADHQMLKFYLRQVCLNTARDDAGARLCYSAKE